jgi:hypothetical protein
MLYSVRPYAYGGVAYCDGSGGSGCGYKGVGARMILFSRAMLDSVLDANRALKSRKSSFCWVGRSRAEVICLGVMKLGLSCLTVRF